MTPDNTNPSQTQRKQAVPVSLIAAAYEWICSHCQHHNREIETHEYVKCDKCKRWSSVAEVLHADG